MDFKLTSLNVNSIVRYGRKYLLDDFISRNPSHVFFLQETKFGPSHRYSFSSFSSFSSFNSAGCGGTLMLVHDGFRVRNFRRLSGIIDGVFVDILIGGFWVTLGSVYVHPRCTSLDSLSSILDTCQHFIIGGDFNARDPSFGDTQANFIGGLLIGMAGASCYDILSPLAPSCYRSTAGSFIDKFLLDANFPFTFSPVYNISSFSDHDAVTISLHCPATDLSLRNGFFVRQFALTDSRRLNRFLESELGALALPTDRNLECGELEVLATLTDDILSRAVERFVPMTFVRANGILLSGTARAAIRGYHSAQRRLRSSRHLRDRDLARIRTEVGLLRQMVVNAVSSDLGDHYRNSMAGVTSMRDAYHTVVTHTGYRRRAKCPATLYADETKASVLSGPAEIAGGFLNQFSANHSLTVNDASDADQPVSEFCDRITSAQFFIPFTALLSPAILNGRSLAVANELLPPSQRNVLTSVAEVTEIVRLAPPKKSSGVDRMPYFLLKLFSPNVLLFLTILFNHLLSRSYFPVAWKRSLVTPIPKPGKDSSILSNWRPISNLNCVSKVFERVIAARLLRHLGSLDLFANQYGFLRGHSSVHALARVHADVCNGLNAGKFTAFVSLDLRAAFDTVWHGALVYKMGQLRFPAFLIRLIYSFLSQRSFSVKLGDYATDFAPMPAGTPQGSVCSPILFNIFLHDLPLDDFVRTIQFADDTSVYCTSDDAGRAQCRLNAHLAALSVFFRRWRLLLNERKTVLMVFLGFAREASRSLRRRFQGLAILLNGHLLRVESRFRLLGLIFDRNNRFVGHVDHALAKARRAFSALRPMLRSSLISPTIKTAMYKTYVRPVLTYASAVFARRICLSAHQMERLRSFERSALRTTAGVRRGLGSFLYASNSRLYERACCPRIDRFITDKAVDFFERCATADTDKLRNLVGPGVLGTFPEICDVWRRHRSDELYDDGLLLDFHHAYDGSGRAVYRTGQ